MLFIHASPAACNSGLFRPCTVDPATLSTKCGRGGECASPKHTNDKGDKAPVNSAGRVVEKTPLHCNETAEKTTLSLDVAGFQADNLSVEIDDSHILIISGERTNKLGDTFVTRRRFALRDNTYDEETVSANLNDGVLEVTILKKSVPKSRKVAISVTPSAATNVASLTNVGAGSSDASTSPAVGTEAVHSHETAPEHGQQDGNLDRRPGDNASSSNDNSNHHPDGAWEHVADHA